MAARPIPLLLGSLSFLGAAALMLGPGHASDPWPFVLLAVGLACLWWSWRAARRAPRSV